MSEMGSRHLSRVRIKLRIPADCDLASTGETLLKEGPGVSCSYLESKDLDAVKHMYW